MRFAFLTLILCAVFSTTPAPTKAQVRTKTRPIQALLVTGGCCHDYDRQKLILTRGISARADVRWTVVHQGGKTTNTAIALYDDPNWADGFDIVVHNECFSDVKDLEFVDRILKPHKDGTPAILIHCAMHCYRTGDNRWFEFVGMQSPGHGPHYSYTADNLKQDHPIMQGFGPTFVAPKGELYHSMKVFDTATPLAQANRESDGMPQVCVWTNEYNKGDREHGTKVFGCTIGHYNETMAEPKYLDMMTKAVLWAVDRDPESDFTPSTEKIDESIKALVSASVAKTDASALPQTCCGDGNLALDKTVTSKSEQNGNFRRHLTDGRLDTRFCPNGAQVNEWVTVDLGEPLHVKNMRLHWERRKGTAYRYSIEASANGELWKTIVDETKNDDTNGIRTHAVDAPDTRYLKTTFLGSSTGGWGSLWEFEAYPGDLPALPETAATGDSPPAGIADVKAPDGFNVSMFGAPPDVNYPVCITAAATGEVFVGVDEMGSLGKEEGRGKVLRCIDTDGDGTADQINEFAKMDHPRGLVYDNGSLWVLHPPTLSVFRDTNGDGTFDASEVLIEGISTNEVAKRGADHTTNGIRMGIDGWIYIAVGDYGFTNAVGKDGTTLSKRGGGIVRVRPDGTEMEIYAWGQRNILDVAIDPYMNIFTRDNTNDGGGWDIRTSHILQTANYGYPSLYKNFTEEIMPPLADHGGGSGCGSMFFQDARWPDGFNNLLLTCDWGTSRVYSHNLPQNGATFDPQQDNFLEIPRPTDIDVDASGRMYVSSWKNGKFAYDGPNIGFVAQVTPIDFVPHPVPDVGSLDDAALVDLLKHPSAAMRLHVQREILRRDSQLDGATGRKLRTQVTETARDQSLPLTVRVAALWTRRQMTSGPFRQIMSHLCEDDDLREHALRAMADRKIQLDSVPLKRFLDGLDDRTRPRVQAASIVGVGRLYSHALRHNVAAVDTQNSQTAAELRASIASKLLTLGQTAAGPVTGTVTIDGKPAEGVRIRFSTGQTTSSGTTNKDGTYELNVNGSKDEAEAGSAKLNVVVETAESNRHAEDWRNPDPARVIPHLAVRTLVMINANEECIAALSGRDRDRALWALKSMYSVSTVDGLFKVLSTSRDKGLRREIWTTLIRLYNKEGDFTADSPKWWGTRPDTTGPYYDRQKWSESDRIADAITVALSEADESLAAHINAQLKRHVVKLEGISEADIAAAKEPEAAIQMPVVDPNNPDQIANLTYDAVLERTMKINGDADAGKALFRSQSCISCHAFANGQQPKGPHLVDIGKRYKKEELVQSIVEPSKKIAQGFDTWTFVMVNGKTYTGFVVLESAETIILRRNNGLSKELLQDDIDDRVKQEISMMPKGVVGNLTAEQLADLIAYLQSLR